MGSKGHNRVRNVHVRGTVVGMMEFIRAPDDSFAGYLQEDSDLEFSDCSDGVRYAYDKEIDPGGVD